MRTQPFQFIFFLSFITNVVIAQNNTEIIKDPIGFTNIKNWKDKLVVYDDDDKINIISDGNKGGTIPFELFNKFAIGRNFTEFKNGMSILYPYNYNIFNPTKYISDGTIQGTKQIMTIWPEFKMLDEDQNSFFGLINFQEKNSIIFQIISIDFKDGKVNTLISNDIFSDGTKIFTGGAVKINGKWIFTASKNFIDSFCISDGTQKGTSIIPEIISPDNFNKVIINGLEKVYFLDKSKNIWISDGTTQGTFKIKAASSNETLVNFPLLFQKTKNGVFFLIANNLKKTELWYSDGTISGTKTIKQFDGNARFMKSNKDDYPLILNDNSVRRKLIGDPYTVDFSVYKTDGTLNGTIQIFGKDYFYQMLNFPSQYDALISDNNIWLENKLYKKTSIYPFDESEPFSFDYEIVRININDNSKKTYSHSYLPFGMYLVGENILSVAQSRNPTTTKRSALFKFVDEVCSHTVKINTPNGINFCTG
jgi:hypothetical protein